ncbi:MAG: carboxypeptidase-like regulatory domain-containing protein [Myxococcota bacterium]|nr:carboxypeptidase-like regulatory domain-containing protein [Myxococcota bacterium]
MNKMFWFVFGLMLAVGCNDGFERDNPFDPDAPTGIQAPATVTGLVLSDQGNDPDSAPAQAGASLAADVTIVELGLTVETDENGAFRFASVPAGQWTLEVEAIVDNSAAAEHMSQMLPFEVSPGDDKSFDNPPIVLRQVPESPMLLSITSGTSEGIETGTLALRFASPALDQGCVDVAFTPVRLGENRAVSWSLQFDGTELIGNASGFEIREIVIDLNESSEDTQSGSKLVLDEVYEVSVRTRRSKDLCRLLNRGISSAPSTSLRYAYQLVAVDPGLESDLLRDDVENRTVGTTFASDGTFLRLHKDGDIAFWDGREFLGCLSLSGATERALSLPENQLASRVSRMREVDGDIFVLLKATTNFLVRFELQAAINASTNALLTGSCETWDGVESLWSGSIRDVVGWSVNSEGWRILESRQATEEFATNLQAFQGSFVSDQTADESISVGNGQEPNPDFVDSEFISGGVLVLMKSLFGLSDQLVFSDAAGTSFSTFVNKTPKDLIMIGDRIVAVLATQGQSRSFLQLFYLDLEGEKFVEVSTTVLPEIVDSMNWLPSSSNQERGLLFLAANLSARLLVMNLDLYVLNSSEVIAQISERGDGGSIDRRVAALEFGLSEGGIGSITSYRYDVGPRVCTAISTGPNHLCFEFAP